MDVKVMETTGDKWEAMNATISESILRLAEQRRIRFDRQKREVKIKARA